jgi:hypothetical protein
MIHSAWKTGWLAIVLLALPVFARAQSHPDGMSQTGSDSKATVTRQRLFSIPFSVNERADPREELQLFVSGDRGQRWTLYQTRPTTAAKFDFRAGLDGEYWFVVGSSRSNARPGQSTQPDKIVVVDTQIPQIDLKVDLLDAGKLTATWSARDARLDAQTFRLSYRAQSDRDWKAIDVVLPARSEDTFQGEASWMVFDMDEPLMVKAEVLDQAGNAGEIVRTVSRASDRDFDITTETRPERTGNTLPRLSDLDSARDEGFTEGPKDKDQERWTTDDHADSASRESRGLITPDAGWRNAAEHDRDLRSETHFRSSLFERRDSITPSPSQPVENDGDESTNFAQPVHFTSSRLFNLEYDVENDGQSKLVRAELWMTRDSGRTWQPNGVDDDLQSPFAVEVTEEGTYGFQLLLHDQEGRSNPAPQPGEAPDMIVEVDTTKPEAYVKSAYHGRDQRPGFVEIDWFADDRNLGDDSITLSYSETIHGPWIIISRRVPNTGHYEWQSPTKLPRSFFVQIDVEDKAGNRTVHRLADPTIMFSDPPRAKLRSVRPAGGT